jgi:hypothetical protein
LPSADFLKLAIGNQKSAMLFVSVGNSSARQVVGRHLNAHAITHQNPDPILSHLAGDSGQNHVLTVIELDFEKGVGLFIDDNALGRDEIFCCQLVSPSRIRFSSGHNNTEYCRFPIAHCQSRHCQLPIADCQFLSGGSSPTVKEGSAAL